MCLPVPEVVGECLKSLTNAPVSIIDDLFACYIAISPRTKEPTYTEKDDMELVGLFDLLLAQPKQNTYLDFIEEFLRTTHRYELYRYLVSIIVAGQRSKVWKMLLEVARRERDQSKVPILLSALTLVQNDPLVADVMRNIKP